MSDGYGKVNITVAEKGDIQSTHKYSVTVEFQIGFDYGGWNELGADYTIKCDGQVKKSGTTTFNIASGNGTTKWASIATTTFDVEMTTSGANKNIEIYAEINTGIQPPKITASGTKTLKAVTWQWNVAYNANGGTNAPSSQTKTYGTNLTLTTSKPKKTGYTFTGWNTAANGSGTSYASGATYKSNANITLYAQWTENYLTVNYYSNYATSAFSDALNTVGATKNVIVRTSKFYYDNAYSDGLHNYSSSSGTTYLTRTGYTATKNWGTSTTGGTLINENTSYSTGQALAKAFGKTLESGNATINLYAQWRENILTVNYHSNCATEFLGAGFTNPTVPGEDAVIRSEGYGYATAPEEGLFDYTTSDGELYMKRIRYDALGYWGTLPDMDIGREPTGDVIEVGEDIAIYEKYAFPSGAELASKLGLLNELETGDVSIDLYALWLLLASRVTIYDSEGNSHRGLSHIYDDDGVLHYAIITVYDEEGNARIVI